MSLEIFYVNHQFTIFYVNQPISFSLSNHSILFLLLFLTQTCKPMICILHIQLINCGLIPKKDSSTNHSVLKGHVINFHFSQGAYLQESQKWQHSFISFPTSVLRLPTHSSPHKSTSPASVVLLRLLRTTNSITYICRSWD
jgi:hypothetical protein